MKTMTDEDLVNEAMTTEYILEEDFQSTRIELLSRLARGRKAIEAMEKLIALTTCEFSVIMFWDKTESIIKDYQEAADEEANRS